MYKSSNYIELDGSYYVIDMDALSGYIVGNDNEKVIEKTKNEQWITNEKKPNDLLLVSKDITETSSSRKDEHAPFRAEVAKMMLTLIMYPTVSENGETRELKRLDMDEMSVGQILSFNTLITEGIIKEVQIDKTDEDEE